VLLAGVVVRAVIEDGWKPSLRDLGFCCLSAVLLLLSFPKFDLDFLAWISLVPLLIALERKGLKLAFILSYLTALIFFSGISYWVWTVSGVSFGVYVVLAAYFSLYGAAFGLGLNWIRNRTGLPVALIAPPLWVTLEYLRGHVSFLSFPWMLLGHSQYQHPVLMQIAAFTGVFGLSFLIVLVNAVIAEMIQHLVRQHLARATAQI
jgi:apolipoprotein N-acyltransferase